MQVKSWPLRSIGVWLYAFNCSLCRISLISVLILSGCASVKVPDTNAIKTPSTTEAPTPGSSAATPIAAEPVAPPKVLHLGLALGDLLAPDRAARQAQAAWMITSEGADVTATVLQMARAILDGTD